MLNKVTEEIYQLVVRFPFGMREVNSYLLKGEKGWTVVDTGSYAKESIDIWERTLTSEINIEKLVLTHAHPDHIGLAGWFQEKYHVPVYISELSYKEMLKMRQNLKVETEFNAFLQKHDGPNIPKRMVDMEVSAYHFEPDDLFGNQQSLKLGSGQYEAIWTPGHSPDHFCFYNHEQNIMLIGDHVLKNISPIIGFSSEPGGNPLKEYFTSLELIKNYPVSVALPGHGDLIKDLKTRVDEIISRHHHRLEQVLESVKDTSKTAREICEEIYGDLNVGLLFSPFISIITRLIYLESLGRVKSEMKAGKFVYRIAERNLS